MLQVSGSQVMNKRWFFAVIGLALFSLDHPALSEATCECADMADLMNREAEKRAAIKAAIVSSWARPQQPLKITS